MKREDFKEITKEHLEICGKLISQEGICSNINCNTCPFNGDNSTCDCTCLGTYANGEIPPYVHDSKLLKSAREFIDKFGGK